MGIALLGLFIVLIGFFILLRIVLKRAQSQIQSLQQDQHALRSEVTAQKQHWTEEAKRQLYKSTLAFLREKPETTVYELAEVGVDVRVAEHVMSPLVMATVRARLPIWLWGDASSGKSRMAFQVAQQFQLNFSSISVCPSTTKADFLGYKDANGQYHSTGFRQRYEQGGVYLIDEIDNGNPQILAVLNGALSNETYSFPDGEIQRHEDFIMIVTANTIGRGANMRYIGRAPLDATTLDRFVFIRMDIDEQLEASLLGVSSEITSGCDLTKGGTLSPKQWLTYVRNVRQAISNSGMDHLVSQRAALYGVKLFKVGVGADYVRDMTIWKGMRDADRQKILAQLPRGSK